MMTQGKDGDMSDDQAADERRKRDADWVTFNAALRLNGLDELADKMSHPGRPSAEFAMLLTQIGGALLMLWLAVAAVVSRAT